MRTVAARLITGIALIAGVAVAPPAVARLGAAGVTCGLTSAPAGGSDDTQQSGVLTGGPVVVAEISTGIDYYCTVLVVTPDGTTWTSAVFGTVGPVGVLPPTAVKFTADPASDRVRVCTSVEWLWAFPSGGFYDLGCREARFQAASGGYVLLPGVASA